MPVNKIITPCSDIIFKYIDKFKDIPNVTLVENTIKKLLTSFPRNNILEEILIKVTTINRLFSTNIYNIYQIAEHIKTTDLDNNLHSGNITAIKSIATGHGIINTKSNNEVRLYSFASKYCNLHNPNCYPKYDYYAHKTLYTYIKYDNFCSYKNDDLYEYMNFKSAIDKFITYYALEKFSYNDIDNYLYTYGNEIFPK